MLFQHHRTGLRHYRCDNNECLCVPSMSRGPLTHCLYTIWHMLKRPLWFTISFIVILNSVFIWIGNERHPSVFFLLSRAGFVLQQIYENFVLQLQAIFHRQCQQPETEVYNILLWRSGWLYNPISLAQDKEVGKYQVACYWISTVKSIGLLCTAQYYRPLL